VLDALAKELREEGHLVARGEPELFHVYHNRNTSRRDHVLFFRVLVEQTSPRSPDYEIAESGFFPLDALPEGVTEATLRRLKELAGEAEKSKFW
jgi:ADP-ribose pyrophosphatase YjhB (NUDIX family)